jgi:hypothetical protein
MIIHQSDNISDLNKIRYEKIFNSIFGRSYISYVFSSCIC